MRIKSRLLLGISFIEGASVMVCELVGAKLLAPFFGTSVSVWAAVLGLTLGGLTTGYYLGGLLSKKYGKSNIILMYILLAASFAMIVMPYTAVLVMRQTLGMDLEAGTIISLLLFMVPPLTFMGMVSPLIINLLTDDSNLAGKSAGNVYAISTVGGILATFLMGFMIIPAFGLKYPNIIAGLLLGLIPLLYFTIERVRGAMAILFLLASGMFIGFRQPDIYNKDYKIRYQSEGIMGQIKVVDHPSYEINEMNKMGRALIVNNTLQTYVDLEDSLQYSLWNWAHYIPTVASIFPPQSKVLLLGLGGGTLVKQLTRLGFSVDVVEIDPRIWDISVEYFNLDRNTTVIIDDARHYIRKSKNKYDIIIYDTFLSESIPEHLLTLEGFEDAKKILNDDGMMLVNFYGAIDGQSGKAARSVLKTFNANGLKTKLLTTPGMENNRNLIFISSRKEQDFSKTRFHSKNYPEIINLNYLFIPTDEIDLSNERILVDDRPELSYLYQRMAKKWRVSYNNYYQRNFMVK